MKPTVNTTDIKIWLLKGVLGAFMGLHKVCAWVIVKVNGQLAILQLERGLE